MNVLPDRVAGDLAYRKARRHREHEQRDACGGYPVLDLPEPENIAGARVGDRLPGGGKVIREIRGMGKVLDWRTSDWTPVNGGKIKPLAFVQHIPVIANKPGIDDFITLRNVLVAQGLMVQSATDREGNVALFTPFDSLCYQARGANQLSCGCEHMHANVSEEWSRKQIRAGAWLAQLAERKHGIPAKLGRFGNGDGVIRVLERGHLSHEWVSKKAGYNDRSDPGPGFDWEYQWHCVDFYKAHGHMDRA